MKEGTIEERQHLPTFLFSVISSYFNFSCFILLYCLWKLKIKTKAVENRAGYNSLRFQRSLLGSPRSLKKARQNIVLKLWEVENFFIHSSHLSLNRITWQDGKSCERDFWFWQRKMCLIYAEVLVNREHSLRSVSLCSLVSICLLPCQGHSIHSFAAIQLSCSQETSEKMWNVVVKVSLRKTTQNTQIWTTYFM